MSTISNHKRYWRANLLILAVLLTVWFVFACVLSILFVEQLNQFRLGGFPLGFWISQQGAMFVFIALIFVYVLLMKRLDRKYRVAEEKRP